MHTPFFHVALLRYKYVPDTESGTFGKERESLVYSACFRPLDSLWFADPHDSNPDRWRGLAQLKANTMLKAPNRCARLRRVVCILSPAPLIDFCFLDNTAPFTCVASSRRIACSRQGYRLAPFLQSLSPSTPRMNRQSYIIVPWYAGERKGCVTCFP